MLLKKLYATFVPMTVVFLLPYTWFVLKPSAWYFSLALLALGGAAWVLIRSRNPALFRLPHIAWPLAGFVLYQVISLAFAPLPYYNAFTALTGVLALLAFLFITDTLQNGLTPRRWENTLVVTAVMIAVVNLILLVGSQIAWSQIAGSFFSLPPVVERASGTLLGHPNLLAAYLNLAIPLVLGWVLAGRDRIGRMVSYGLMFFLIIVVFLTYSRTGWASLAGSLAVVLGLYYAPVLSGWLRRPRQALRASGRRALWIVVGVTVILLPILAFAVYWNQQATHGTLGMRVAIWQHAWKQFAASPLWGNGAGSMVVALAGRGDAIGGDEVYHAHNMLLQVAAEYGLIGLGLLLVMLALAGRAWFYAWKAAPAGSAPRAALAAYAGIGVGILLHEQLDYLLWSSLYSVGAMMILALACHQPDGQHIPVKKTVMLPVIAGLLVLLIGGRLYTTRGVFLYQSGVQAAAAGNWNQAQAEICQAARDTPPATYYTFICALASAELSSRSADPSLLQTALQNQERGLASDPGWYIHWANLASYEIQLGRGQKAIEHMQQAVKMAPNIARLRLNLAWIEEQAGEHEAASTLYRQLICQAPGLTDSLFFQGTDLRQNLAQAGCPERDTNPGGDPFQSSMEEGKLALQDGDLERAEQAFIQAQQANPQHPDSYAYLGLVHQQAGQPDLARQDLLAGLYINPNSLTTLLTAAQVFEQQGLTEDARWYRWDAFQVLSAPLPSKVYYYDLYRLPPLPSDLSPYLVWDAIPQELQVTFEKLAADLEIEGKIQQSKQVRSWLQARQRY